MSRLISLSGRSTKYLSTARALTTSPPFAQKVSDQPLATHAAIDASASPTPPPRSATVVPHEAASPPLTATGKMAEALNKIVKLDLTSKLPLDPQRSAAAAAAFDEVPGPELLRKIAKVWSYVPILGNHMTAHTLQHVLSAGQIFGSQLSWGNYMWLFHYLLNEYGPIVRLHSPFGGKVVILSRPEHATAVFDSDGQYPVRASLPSIEKYRLQHRKYKNAGPFLMHGPEWEAMRKDIEPALHLSVEHQCTRISRTADDFIERVLAIRNQQLEVPKTFLTELQKWSLECLGNVTFNKSFGFLDVRGLSSTSDNAVLLNAITGATEAIRKCEYSFHIWKKVETPSWKKLVLHCDTIDHILGSNLRKAQQQLRERKEKHAVGDGDERPEDVSLIDYFLLKESMANDDILTVLLDMILLGVNMTAYTAGFLMYHLAKNQRAQLELYNEIKILPENISMEGLKNLTYLKACLYESLRLKPPMPILNRVLNKDITIYGYKIPKGTFVLIATNLSSLREEHFEDPLKFKPERWIGMDNGKDMANLATIPFGHGPKDCIAKELAEIQLYYLIIKVLRRFRVEYHYGDISSNNKLLSSPSRPFRFRLVERE